jgi:hypothetical protein
MKCRHCKKEIKFINGIHGSLDGAWFHTLSGCQACNGEIAEPFPCRCPEDCTCNCAYCRCIA